MLLGPLALQQLQLPPRRPWSKAACRCQATRRAPGVVEGVDEEHEAGDGAQMAALTLLPRSKPVSEVGWLACIGANFF